MFKNTFQSGFLSILYSIGSKPLQIWDKKVRGCGRRRGVVSGLGLGWQVLVSSWGLGEARSSLLCPGPSLG